jgi:hypothetical protein
LFCSKEDDFVEVDNHFCLIHQFGLKKERKEKKSLPLHYLQWFSNPNHLFSKTFSKQRALWRSEIATAFNETFGVSFKNAEGISNVPTVGYHPRNVFPVTNHATLNAQAVSISNFDYI